jgi:Bacterial antitoxin of type II TA system, VapB
MPNTNSTKDKAMTTIIIDDELINEVIAVSHHNNAQEAVTKILSDYLQQQKKELPLFERLRFIDESTNDDLALLFERDRDTGRDFEL